MSRVAEMRSGRHFILANAICDEDIVQRLYENIKYSGSSASRSCLTKIKKRIYFDRHYIQVIVCSYPIELLENIIMFV